MKLHIKFWIERGECCAGENINSRFRNSGMCPGLKNRTFSLKNRNGDKWTWADECRGVSCLYTVKLILHRLWPYFFQNTFLHQ